MELLPVELGFCSLPGLPFLSHQPPCSPDQEWGRLPQRKGPRSTFHQRIGITSSSQLNSNVAVRSHQLLFSEQLIDRKS